MEERGMYKVQESETNGGEGMYKVQESETNGGEGHVQSAGI